MRARLVALLVLPGLVLGVAGCVPKRTPEARFFVLRSLVEPPATPAADAPASLVGVLPVRMPGYIDRPQLVTWTAPGELRIDEFLRWAEPLDAGITRTVAENLDALLPESHVVRFPAGGQGRAPLPRVAAARPLRAPGGRRGEARGTVGAPPGPGGQAPRDEGPRPPPRGRPGRTAGPDASPGAAGPFSPPESPLLRPRSAAVRRAGERCSPAARRASSPRRGRRRRRRARG